MRGFSLVELSIVLVILGLLTGGILAGQSLIRAAELRSLTAQYQNYRVAIATFRDKYFALPGDMTNATSFWGAIDPTPATCITLSSTTTATCDGNGNGMVGNPTMSERFHAWKHLANAGLVEGTYSGLAGPTAGGQDMLGGINVPTAKISNVVWGLWGNPGGQTISGDVTFNLSGTYGLTSMVGIRDTSYHGLPVIGFLTPSELWNIDVKLDDGLPRGRVKASIWSTCVTAASQSDLNAVYTLSSSNKGCGAYFEMM